MGLLEGVEARVFEEQTLCSAPFNILPVTLTAGSRFMIQK